MHKLTWYLPTFYGDIRLERKGDKLTLVHWDHLSPSEVEAMRLLRSHALTETWARSCWATDFPLPTTTGVGTVELAASIAEVQKRLARALKPGRALVTAVRFTDGKVEEMREAEMAPEEGPSPSKPSPYREPASLPAPEKEPKTVAEQFAPNYEDQPNVAKEAIAVTVAQPMLGCPVPEFERAEIRATRVLEAFLDEEQIEDFRRRQQFVSVGADTGHRYLLTSRHARERMTRVDGRSLFDLDAADNVYPVIIDNYDGHRVHAGNERIHGLAICAHDWTVPAAEELLALHLFVSMQGQESYLLSLPPEP